jgi:murein DD-endopeptidase MepM/ murein hydrolase activator NlpD
LNPDEYVAEEDLLKSDILLSDYLSGQGLSEPVVRELTLQAENKGLERLEKNHEIIALKPKDGNPDNRLFLYKMSANKSILFRLAPLPEVQVRLKKIENHVRAAGGIIKTSLWEALLDYNIHFRLMEQMEDAMQWSVDFYHLQPGDKFKVIYEEKRAGNEVVGIGQLKAVYFKTGEKEYCAYNVDGIDKAGYYDENGKPVKKTFLRCPVKYERITSAYNLERIHPVTGNTKPHLGTDFGAPQGAPIFSVGDGVVELADFSANNGNYVKIRHDMIYETQYLHMEGFEEGIRPGSLVKQGQIIGYVGQTGLATGPHVCYRFWKNGEQVNPDDEPDRKPFYMSIKDHDRYLALKDELDRQLRDIVYFDGKF